MAPLTPMVVRPSVAVPLLVMVRVAGEESMLTTDTRFRVELLMAKDGAVVAGPESATAIGLLVGSGSVPVAAGKLMSALAVRVLLDSAKAGLN